MKKKVKKEPNKIRDLIADQYDDIPLLFMDPKDYDEAIIGVANGYNLGPMIAYDYEKVIEVNMKDGGTREDAEEYFEFNQIGSYVGEHTPIFIKTTKTIKEEIQ